MDERVKNEPDILRASRILISEAERPRRLVLRRIEKGGNRIEFVTHEEVLRLDMTATCQRAASVGDGHPMFEHDGFNNGHYFQNEEEAHTDYNERCKHY